jgi:hypothetical protein
MKIETDFFFFHSLLLLLLVLVLAYSTTLSLSSYPSANTVDGQEAKE